MTTRTFTSTMAAGLLAIGALADAGAATPSPRR